MPQMSPIMWTLIMVLTFIVILMTMTMIYFYFSPISPKFKMKEMSVKYLNWLW